MCTAVTFRQNEKMYFGRTLDYEMSFGEEVVITPRCYPFSFTGGEEAKCHYAIIGMAHVEENYPLYYEAMNEKGLCAAGLNFVGNAYYCEREGKKSVAQYEFLQYILSKYSSVSEVKEALSDISITGIPFSEKLPGAMLHWLIADEKETICVESVKEGVKVYDNAVGVLTNNPPFEFQMSALNNFRHISASSCENTFAKDLSLKEYSRGMGALGLPGDLSSQSRFVRAAFTSLNSICGAGEEQSAVQVFHIMETVSQTRGCCRLENGECELTIYTSCMSPASGVYYYTTYDCPRICAIDLKKEQLDLEELLRFEIVKDAQILRVN